MGTVRRRGRYWALAAGGIGFAMTFLYIGIIVSQGDTSWGPVTFFGTVMMAASTAALAAEAISDVETCRRLLVFSAFLFALVGVLALFTIGLGFLVAAGLAAIGVVRLADRPTVTEG